jgi:dienelactone hydrolase
LCATEQANDLQRSIDYLETRGDIDTKLAFFGISWGGIQGSIMLALEERFQVAVLLTCVPRVSKDSPARNMPSDL